MSLESVFDRGLLLIGCGKMGSAMLAGWLDAGLDPSRVDVVDPAPSDWLTGLQGRGLRLNADLPPAPAVCMIAVKPQTMSQALPALAGLGAQDTLFLSIAAGTPISAFERALGAEAAIVRAMPNTPAAINKGITAIIGNGNVSEAQLALSEALLAAIGDTVRLQTEAQMDAVTGLSGSGPAYVFHLIECLAAAGVAEGLPPEMAMTLARATVAGAGALAVEAGEPPGVLRQNVTSPNGTTQAGLEVLMDPQAGLPPLIVRTVGAAAERSRELAAQS